MRDKILYQKAKKKPQRAYKDKLSVLLDRVVYADMYDFALRESDLVGTWGFASEEIAEAKKRKVLEASDGFVFLPGRKGIVAKTQKAMQVAKEKIQVARRKLKFFNKIPWVKMVALSGSIGARNSKPDDDFDVFLIVSPHSKWLVRFLEYIYFGLFKRNRAFNANPERRNKVCTNMIAESQDLEMPLDKQNLFVAYQCLLLEPIYRQEYYQKFLQKNRWLEGLFGQIIRTQNVTELTDDASSWVLVAASIIPNFILGTVQKAKIKMSGGDLSKVDRGGMLFFHPQDPSHRVIENFELKRSSVRKQLGV